MVRSYRSLSLTSDPVARLSDIPWSMLRFPMTTVFPKPTGETIGAFFGPTMTLKGGATDRIKAKIASLIRVRAIDVAIKLFQRLRKLMMPEKSRHGCLRQRSRHRDWPPAQRPALLHRRLLRQPATAACPSTSTPR